LGLEIQAWLHNLADVLWFLSGQPGSSSPIQLRVQLLIIFIIIELLLSEGKWMRKINEPI